MQLAFFIIAALSIIMSTAQSTPSVLVFTATAGYRHDSIPSAIAMFRQQGPQYGINFSFSECVATWSRLKYRDVGIFNDASLAQFDGVVFALNSDTDANPPVSRESPRRHSLSVVIGGAGETALKTYFQKGGVYAGYHSGSACLYNDSDYAVAAGGASWVEA